MNRLIMPYLVVDWLDRYEAPRWETAPHDAMHCKIATIQGRTGEIAAGKNPGYMVAHRASNIDIDVKAANDFGDRRGRLHRFEFSGGLA